MITITRYNYPHQDFVNLFKLLDVELNERYGVLQALYEQYNVVEGIKNFVVAYKDEIPVGCGSFKKFDDNTIEVKRFYLIPELRGSGIAGLILSEIEAWGKESGYTDAVLETGIAQPEAIRFYSKNRYEKMENFGQYIGNHNSVCMGKKLKSVEV